MTTTTLEHAVAPVVETERTDDPGKAAHIILVPPDRQPMSVQAYLLEARVEGTPIRALCGHTWVPSRDPKVLPLCTRCEAIYKNDPRGHGDRDDLPEG